MAHCALIDKPDTNGATDRDTLTVREQQLRRTHGVGSDEHNKIQAELEGPSCPESLEYLRDALDDVFGRSGTTMDGLAPLSWATVEYCERNGGTRLDFLEKSALFTLDTVRRHPESVTRD